REREGERKKGRGGSLRLQEEGERECMLAGPACADQNQLISAQTARLYTQTNQQTHTHKHTHTHTHTHKCLQYARQLCRSSSPVKCIDYNIHQRRLSLSIQKHTSTFHSNTCTSHSFSTMAVYGIQITWPQHHGSIW